MFEFCVCDVPDVDDPAADEFPTFRLSFNLPTKADLQSEGDSLYLYPLNVRVQDKDLAIDENYMITRTDVVALIAALKTILEITEDDK